MADGRAVLRSMTQTPLMHAPGPTGVVRGNTAWVVAPIFVGALVLYGSFIPFGFSWEHLTRSARQPHFGYVLSPTTVEDCVVNVLVYAAFGLTMAFCVARRGRSSVRTMVVTILVGTAVSFSVEFLQLGLSARVSSWRSSCLLPRGVWIRSGFPDSSSLGFETHRNRARRDSRHRAAGSLHRPSPVPRTPRRGPAPMANSRGCFGSLRVRQRRPLGAMHPDRNPNILGISPTRPSTVADRARIQR